MIKNHNCCIKLVPLVIFIYDARSHIHQRMLRHVLCCSYLNINCNTPLERNFLFAEWGGDVACKGIPWLRGNGWCNKYNRTVSFFARANISSQKIFRRVRAKWENLERNGRNTNRGKDVLRRQKTRKETVLRNHCTATLHARRLPVACCSLHAHTSQSVLALRVMAELAGDGVVISHLAERALGQGPAGSTTG